MVARVPDIRRAAVLTDVLQWCDILPPPHRRLWRTAADQICRYAIGNAGRTVRGHKRAYIRAMTGPQGGAYDRLIVQVMYSLPLFIMES